MAKFLKLVALLLLATYNFSFTFSQFHLEPASRYKARRSGSGHVQRKASDLTDLYTSKFETRMDGHPAMKGTGYKVPHQWQAAVETHSKRTKAQRRQKEEEIMPEQRRKADRKDRKKKEESEVVEDNYPASIQAAEVKKSNLRKGHHSRQSKKKQEKSYDEKKKEARPKQMCNKKCFTPNCDVECIGEQASAACSAPRCKALTRGEDSAALCSGDSCHSLCFKEECISGCEGTGCQVKCHGKKCHAVAEGSAAGSVCEKEECMAYGNGNRTQIKCEGESCQAQCIGEKCTAECIGKNCVSGCSGKGCTATCEGKYCQHLENIGEVAVDLGNRNSDEISMANTDNAASEDDGYYGNKNLIDYKNPGTGDSKEANKDITTPEGMGKNGKEENYGDGKVRLEYSIDVRLTPALVWYIRDKISNLKKMAGYVQYLRIPAMGLLN